MKARPGPYIWEAQSSRHCVCLLKGDDIDEIGMYGAQMGLSSRPKWVLNYRLIVLGTFKKSKHRIKIAAMMLPLPTEATSEEKTNTCTDWRHPTYHRRLQMIIMKERKKERRGGGGGGGKKNKESLIKTFKTERCSFFFFLFFSFDPDGEQSSPCCCNLTVMMTGSCRLGWCFFTVCLDAMLCLDAWIR